MHTHHGRQKSQVSGRVTVDSGLKISASRALEYSTAEESRGHQLRSALYPRVYMNRPKKPSPAIMPTKLLMYQLYVKTSPVPYCGRYWGAVPIIPFHIGKKHWNSARYRHAAIRFKSDFLRDSTIRDTPFSINSNIILYKNTKLPHVRRLGRELSTSKSIKSVWRCHRSHISSFIIHSLKLNNTNRQKLKKYEQRATVKQRKSQKRLWYDHFNFCLATPDSWP